jgi:transcriptional regulator with XRE-family HTH domain
MNFNDHRFLDIANRIQSVQEVNNVSLDDMAELFGISTSQYRKLLNANGMFTEDKLLTLSDKFNVSMDYIFTGNIEDMRSAFKNERPLSDYEFDIFIVVAFEYIGKLPPEEKQKRMSTIAKMLQKTFDALVISQ